MRKPLYYCTSANKNRTYYELITNWAHTECRTNRVKTRPIMAPAPAPSRFGSFGAYVVALNTRIFCPSLPSPTRYLLAPVFGPRLSHNFLSIHYHPLLAAVILPPPARLFHKTVDDGSSIASYRKIPDFILLQIRIDCSRSIKAVSFISHGNFNPICLWVSLPEPAKALFLEPIGKLTCQTDRTSRDIGVVDAAPVYQPPTGFDRYEDTSIGG